MKFLVALLALPAAALAAPTSAEVVARDDNPPFFVFDTFACACTNAAGEPDGSCPYGDSKPDIGELSHFCFITSHWAKPIEQVMNSVYCKQQNPAYPTAVCKPIKLCLRYPQCTNYNDTYNLCGMTEEIPDYFCQKGQR